MVIGHRFALCVGAILLCCGSSNGQIDCNYCDLNTWLYWGECSQCCGGSGTQTRQRREPVNEACVRDCGTAANETRPCNRHCWNGGSLVNGSSCLCQDYFSGSCCETGCYPTHCTWKTWSFWSVCTQTCGGTGEQTRRRENQQTAMCNGTECIGDTQETRPCNRFCLNGGTIVENSTSCQCQDYFSGTCCENGCSPRHCTWKDWSFWSECTQTCGGTSEQTRRRENRQTALCNGTECIGDTQETRPCNRFCKNGGTLVENSASCQCQDYFSGSCCEAGCYPRHCTWKTWLDWSECTEICGATGEQTRRRERQQTALCRGTECVGPPEQTRPCNRLCQNGGTLTSSSCSCPDYTNGVCCERMTCSPVDCQWSPWSAWGMCTTMKASSVEYSIEGRGRYKQYTASCGGRDCDGERTDSRFCENGK